MSRELEHQEQVALFNWARTFEGKHPALGMMFAIPNGGDRHPVVGAKMKAEGVKKGVPDIFLPVCMYRGSPEDRDPGLFIEMKIKPNKPSKEQKERVWLLEEYGYQCRICYSWVEAALEICAYLNLDPIELGLEPHMKKPYNNIR